MDRLKGKVAFVTGGGAGIAKATARIFAREGASVVVAEINPVTGAATAKEITDAGGRALFIETDVASEDSIRKAVAAGVAAFGELSVLFNCAGGPLHNDSYVTDVDLDVWRRTMTVDVLGAMLCCRHVIPSMVRGGGGSVVNMSSGAALRGGSNAHIYTAAKGSILSLTRAMAGAYVQQGIRVNALCAGRVLTERTRKKYGYGGAAADVADRQDGAGRIREYPLWLGEPEDIGNVALFLASDESRMITGATIAADGGRSAY
jgi:NAD(P)-dependent dehydrogenase (short-subunit alcohol dehydrogenase family)